MTEKQDSSGDWKLLKAHGGGKRRSDGGGRVSDRKRKVPMNLGRRGSLSRGERAAPAKGGLSFRCGWK